VTDIGGDFLALRGYLAGDLPPEQMRSIEERLERDPRLVRELELHLRMREGLAQVQVQRAHAMAAARRRELRAWSSGLAAAAGCAGVALLLWTQPGAPHASLLRANAAAGPAAAQFTFVPVRGDSKPDLELPASGRIELRAAPGPAQGSGRYRVTLVRQGANGERERLGDLTGVSAGADGYLHSYVDASRLSPGEYLLRVEPDLNAAGAGEAFQFRLRTPAH
jgi:hypothetical protein